MKVVAYSIKPFEKEYLIRANQKKHEITLISNPLDVNTTAYAEGKDAVLVFTHDDASAPVIEKLAALGVKFIATRSASTDHIDINAACEKGIKLASLPSYSPQAVAEHAVTMALALNRKIIRSDEMCRNYDFRLDELIGFNFYKKTIGIIGLGHAGQAVAAIFNGFGCKVLGYDPEAHDELENIELVALDMLLALSDIISIHAPLTDATRHIINSSSISAMKDGVMLINVSHGPLINTFDVLNGLDSGKIGYLGLDAYESEKAFFFEDNNSDKNKDKLFKRLIGHPNVLITPNQAFLTREALEEIATQTIQNLDNWQREKCNGDACACNKPCQFKTAPKTALHKNLNHLP